MKLYIITSSLNIDNILSSESISPIFLYQKKSFGYKYFEKIKGLDFPDGQIVLFEFTPYFEIVDSERSNYPIVLEIEDDHQLNDSSLRKVDNSIWVTDKTIYVTPFNCKILYFSHEAIREIDLICSDSKTNKSYKYYQKSLIDKKYSFDISKTDLTHLQDDYQNENDDIVNEADQINRKKGLQYAWYLGSGKSIKPECAKLKAIEREICDYISAIKNNNGIGTEQYQAKVKELDEEYKKHDPNISLANSLWEERIQSFCSNKNEFAKFVVQVGGEIRLKNDFLKYHNISVRRHIRFDSYDEYTLELKRYTDSLCSQQAISFEFFDDNVSDSLFKQLTEYIIKNKISLDTIRLRRQDVTMEFIKQIRSYVEANNRNWGSSEESTYLRSLMENIDKALPFDFSATENIVLKSVAAFLLKGNDYDDMISYLQYNAMDDYRYVLGFWGTACGYVDMSRSITKSLFESDDIDQIEKVYKHIYCQLHGYELSGSLNKSNVNSTIPSKMNEAEKVVTVGREQIIPECLQPVFNSDAFKKMKSEAQDWYREKTLDLWPKFGQNTEVLISKLKKLQSDPMAKGKKGWGKWKDCIKSLEATKPRKRSAQSQQQGTLFDPKQEYPIGEYFYNDNNVWIHIEPIVPDSKKEKVKKEIEWIQDAHQKGGYNKKDGTFNECKEKDNESVIKHFYRNNKNKIEEPLLTDVCKKLKELYHVK